MQIRVLSKALQNKAEEELNEIPDQLAENIEHIKCWLEKQEHLKYKNDDQILLNFLRGSKFNLQRAKEKIDAYYTFRTLAPELALNMDPYLPAIQKYFKMGICLPLPISKEDPAGPRVILVRYDDGYDPDEITLTTMLKGALMIFDILLNEDDNYVVSGTKVIWDMKNIQFKTAVQATPSMIKKIVYCYEKALPTRLKAVYVINMPIFFEKILNVCKLLVSDKLAKRLHFYSTDNWKAIYHDISKSSIPKEYGGEGGFLADIRDAWYKKVQHHRERLLNENYYYSDESKRRVESNSLSTVYGVDGSFRKLSID